MILVMITALLAVFASQYRATATCKTRLAFLEEHLTELTSKLEHYQRLEREQLEQERIRASQEHYRTIERAWSDPAHAADAVRCEIAAGTNELGKPFTMALDHDGRIHVVDSAQHRLRIFDRNGTYIKTFGVDHLEADEAQRLFQTIRSVSFDSRGRAIMIAGGRVAIFDRDERWVRSYGEMGSLEPGMFQHPQFGTVVDQDRFLVVDTFNNKLQLFDRDGKWLHTIGSAGNLEDQLNLPYGVAFDKQERRLIVANAMQHKLAVYDLDGAFVRSIGGKGSGKGQFMQPVQVAIHEQRGLIAVSDLANHRVVLLDRRGGFLRQYGSKGTARGCFVNPRGLAFVVSEGEDNSAAVLLAVADDHHVQLIEVPAV